MLILASASPRRRELLIHAGFTFKVHPAHIPEDPHPNEDPIAYVVRLAREKAETVFRELALKGHDFSRAISDSKRVRALAPEGSSSEASAKPGAPKPGSPRTGLSPWGGEPVLSLPKDLASETRESANLDPQTLAVLGADTTVTLDNHILGKPEDPADAARMLRLLSGRTHLVVTGVALVTAARTEVAAEVTGVKFLTLSDEEIEAYIATGEPMDKAGAYAIQGRTARWVPRIEGDYFNVVGLPIALVSALLESL